MIQVGTPLSDIVGTTDITFAASSGTSQLGDVLSATGFDAQEQEVSAPSAEAGNDIAGLVRTNIAPRAKGYDK